MGTEMEGGGIQLFTPLLCPDDEDCSLKLLSAMKVNAYWAPIRPVELSVLVNVFQIVKETNDILCL